MFKAGAIDWVIGYNVYAAVGHVYKTQDCAGTSSPIWLSTLVHPAFWL
jgi:hypothetical protein